MIKNLVVILLNLLLIILILLVVPNLNNLKIWLYGGLVIITPLIIGVIFYKIKKEYSTNIIFILSVLASLFFFYMLIVMYQSHKRNMDLDFDKYHVHHLQNEVEKNIKQYIIENALFPESYEPISFDNLDSMIVSKLARNLQEQELTEQVKRGEVGVIDSLIKQSEFQHYGNYFIRHSYFLKNRDGKRLARIAFIELNRNLHIKTLYNQEDFIKISWIDHFGKDN